MSASAVYLDCTPTMRAFYDRVGAPILPDLRVHMGDPDPERIPALLAGAAGALNGHTYMPRNVLERCDSLRVVVFLGTGISTFVDLEAAAELGIAAFAIEGYGSRTIAEHTIGLMFAAVRQIALQDRELRAGHWEHHGGFELEGKTFGVVGLGSVGQEVAKLAAALGMRVLAHARRPPGATLPVSAVDLDTLLAESDVVSVHIAHTPETEGFIGRDELARMKPTAVLLNTARGALVDEGALADALLGGRLAHAGVDVYAREPLAADHPFARIENITLTSHCAWNSPEAAERLLVWGLEKLRDELPLRPSAGRSVS